jgi:hypothetical protein
MPIRVAIPCRRFNLRAHLGYAEGLSQFEQFALRLLAAKPSSAVELAATLGLEERMALDVCVDLVKAGLAELHLDSGRLEPTSLVRQKLGDGADPSPDWAIAFATERAPESEDVELLQELVSGAVFPAPRRTFCAVRDLVAPEKHGLPALETLEHTVLAAAAARAVEAGRARRSAVARTAGDVADEDPPGLKVVDVSLATTQRVQGASDANAWRERIQVEVDVLLDEEGEIRDIRVVEPRSIPRSARRAIARGLLELRVSGLRDEEGQFFDLLRERARNAQPPASDGDAGEDWDPQGKIDALAKKVAEVASMKDAALEDLAKQHEMLLGLWDVAREEVVEAASRGARPVLVDGTAAHHALVLDALQTAQEQIVIATPWMGQLSTNQLFRDAMADAVARGVRIHLVWGIDPDERRQDWPREIAELCAALDPRGNGTGGVFTSGWSAGVHAKLLVKDLDWMLVSSCNFLNAARERSAIELGVRVSLHRQSGEPVTEETAERVVRNAGPMPATLAWARSVVPDFAIRRTMIVDPVLGGIAGLPPPIELQQELRAPENEITRMFWSGWWQKRVDSLREYFGRIGTCVVPTFDLAHRGLLFEALESAHRRVVISSDKLGVGLLGLVPFEATKAARARGVDVTVVFAEMMPAEDFEKRRAELEALGVNFVRTDVHAKALVADEKVCISSFNFLSFEGIGRAGRVRRELGVRVFENGFAEKVIDALLHRDPT